jgi:hypothetical protein
MITTTKQDGSVEVTSTGCVVRVWGESVQVMSDIYEYHTYALAFDNDTGTFVRHFLYSDYGTPSEKRSATVDATDEIVALYEASEAVKAAQKALEHAQNVRETALAEVRSPSRGKTLKVIRGRKVPVGTVGECTWFGVGKGYGYRPGRDRVGMKVNGETVYTDAHNVEVVVG